MTDGTEHRFKFAVFHQPWLLLHMSEISRQKTTNIYCRLILHNTLAQHVMYLDEGFEIVAVYYNIMPILICCKYNVSHCMKIEKYILIRP